MIKNILCLGSVFFIISCSVNFEKNIQVLTAKKLVDTTLQGAAVCDDFLLTKSEIATYFDTAEQISNEEEHSESIVMPCKYSGKLTMDSHTYSYELFAGGTGYIYDDKGWVVKNFICNKSSCCSRFSNLC